MTALATVIAALVGLAYTVRVCRTTLRSVFSDPRPIVPAWLDAALPLKGRWLRRLLTAPALFLILALIWTAVSGLVLVALLILLWLFGIAVAL